MDLKNNQEFQGYLHEVCSQVKFLEAHAEIRAEFQAHIGEAAEKLMETGLDEHTAITQAIQRMGNAKTVGHDLNRIHRPRPDWTIIIILALLTAVGLLTGYLLDGYARANWLEIPNIIKTNSIFITSLLIIPVGLMAAAALYFFDYRRLKPCSVYVYGTVVFILILLAKSDIYLFMSRNFIAVSPLILSIALAGILDRLNWNNSRHYWLSLGLLFIPFLVMVIKLSPPAAIIYALMFMTQMLVARAKIRQVLTSAGLLLTGLPIFLVTAAPYRLNRLYGWIWPQSDPYTVGYLPIQLGKLREAAGLFGQGFASDYRFIPDLHTDFVFSYILHAFGWLAGIVLVVAIIFLLFRMFTASRKIKNTYGKLMLSGITAVLAARFCCNIMMNLGVLPHANIGLPFISFGRADMLLNMVVLGLVMSIYRRKNLLMH